MTESDEHISYWQQQLAGAPPALALPFDFPRPPVPSFIRASVSIVLERDLGSRLTAISGKRSVDPSTILFTALRTVLFRYSGQDDCLLWYMGQSGAVPALPPRLFPYRSAVDGQSSGDELIKQTVELLAQMSEHSSISLSSLAKLVPLDSDGGIPTINSAFVSHGSSRHSAVEAEGFLNDCDIVVAAEVTDGEFRLSCQYDEELFSEATMVRMLGHLRTALAGILASPQTLIPHLPIATEAEREDLLLKWNQTQRDYPSSDCLHRLFEQQAERTPDKIAVRFAGQTINYAELERRANQLAHYLKDRGAGPEVLIGICTDRSIDMVVGLLGILKAGAAYVPIDPAFPKDRIAFMLEDSATRILVTQDAFANHLPTQGLDVVCLDRDADAWSNCSDVAPHTEATAENLAYVIFTSGSTGRPKGVQISHRAFINFLDSMQHTPGMSAEDTLLAVTTLSFDIAGLEIFLPLITGATIEMVNSETAADAVKLMDSFEQSRATIMQATPATWRMLIEAGWRGTPDLKVLCGGEAMPRDLIDPLLECCGELWNMYGPTETTVYSSLERIRSSDGLISVGRPIDNTQMYILDKQLQPVPVGVTGELYIGGDGLARGYLKRPDLTKERFIQDPFSVNQQARLYNTGDLARYFSDGRIECLGRKDQQVKIRGYRIELGEIEAVLSMHPQVRESAVVDREFAPGDVRLVAYVVFMPNATESPADLQAALRNQLPNYMMPSSFVTLNELPQTPNGKLDRKSLANMDVVATRIEETYQAPSDQIELHLCQLWEELLNVKPIGVRDDFFNLGGHSLLSVQLMVRIEETYGKRLPLATLLQARTIVGLAKILRSGNWQPKWRSLVPIREAGSSTPLFLFHSHGGNVLEYNSLVSQLPTDRPVNALQARGLDGDIPTDNSIVDMAPHYIQEIREFQPEGPYYLVGYCFGGCLALEAACQLEEAGEEVVFVGLIQSMTPKYTRYMNGGNWFAKSYRRMKRRGEVELNEFHQIGPKFLFARLIQLKEKVQGRMEVWLESVRQRPDGSPRKSSLPHILELLSRENEKAFWQHSPKSCSCPVALFPAEKQLRSQNVDPALGWHEVLDTQTSIHKVPGHQQSLLKMPHVKVLADRLNACILAAEHSDTKNKTIEYDDRLPAESAH